MEFIEYGQVKAVGVIKLNRPKSFNSFTVPMAKELQACLDQCKLNPEIRAILITGNGKAFCAGQDLKEATGENAPKIEELIEVTYEPIIKRIRSVEKPIVAAVNGVAAGAGANIALACDLTLAGESAGFIQAFSSIGLVPDSAGSYTLPRLVGMQRAAAQFYLAEKVSAKEAQDMGMIYKCVPDSELMEASITLALTLSSRPTKAIGFTKRLLNATFENSLNDQLALEKELQAKAGKTNDNKEGIAAFLEKRKPNFIGS